jgi:hypothetical protein
VAETFNSTLGDKVREFFGEEVEDATTLMQTVRQNLSEGNFRFVVLMDRLEDRLKTLLRSSIAIASLQSTVSRWSFKFDKFEILIPKLYGAEVTKEVSAPKLIGTMQKWDEGTFLQRLKMN